MHNQMSRDQLLKLHHPSNKNRASKKHKIFPHRLVGFDVELNTSPVFCQEERSHQENHADFLIFTTAKKECFEMYR
jgi:hypothetical protein